MFKILAISASALLMTGAQTASFSGFIPFNSGPESVAKLGVAILNPGPVAEPFREAGDSTPAVEVETVIVTLSHEYQDGFLSVSLLPSPDLQILSFAPPVNTPVSEGSKLELPIRFSGTAAGQFTLSLEAIYQGYGGQHYRRVLSVPVTVGSGAVKRFAPAGGSAVYTTSKPGEIGPSALEILE